MEIQDLPADGTGYDGRTRRSNSSLEYARMALNRPEPSKENIMCVIDEACSSCVQINYEITNLCRGCGTQLLYELP